MSCPVRKKGDFLLWKEVIPMPHEWKILEIGVHMAGVSDKFKVERECKHCGKWELQHFVEYEELIRLGYSKEELKEALRNEI